MLQYSKDGTSVSAMLDTRRTKSDGKCPVKIRVTHRRTRWYYPTGKDLTPEEVVGVVDDESPRPCIDPQRHREQLPNRALGR